MADMTLKDAIKMLYGENPEITPKDAYKAVQERFKIDCKETSVASTLSSVRSMNNWKDNTTKTAAPAPTVSIKTVLANIKTVRNFVSQFEDTPDRSALQTAGDTIVAVGSLIEQVGGLAVIVDILECLKDEQ